MIRRPPGLSAALRSRIALTSSSMCSITFIATIESSGAAHLRQLGREVPHAGADLHRRAAEMGAHEVDLPLAVPRSGGSAEAVLDRVAAAVGLENRRRVRWTG